MKRIRDEQFYLLKHGLSFSDIQRMPASTRRQLVKRASEYDKEVSETVKNR